MRLPTATLPSRALLLGLALMLGLALFGIQRSQAASSPRLTLSGYGKAHVGNTPAEVQDALGERLTCFYRGRGCVCAVFADGQPNVTFAFRLDGAPGLDVILTSARGIVGPRGLRVGDEIRQLRHRFPHAHRTGGGYRGVQRYLVGNGSAGMLAEARHEKIRSFTVGKRRFLGYDEFCG